MKATMTALAVAATIFANSPWAADPDDLQELVDNGYFVKCDLTGANLKGANLWAAQRATDSSFACRHLLRRGDHQSELSQCCVEQVA